MPKETLIMESKPGEYAKCAEMNYNAIESLPTREEALKLVNLKLVNKEDFNDVIDDETQMVNPAKLAEYTKMIKFKYSSVADGCLKFAELVKYPGFLSLFDNKDSFTDINLADVMKLFSPVSYQQAMDEQQDEINLSEAASEIIEVMVKENRLSPTAELTQEDKNILIAHGVKNVHQYMTIKDIAPQISLLTDDDSDDIEVSTVCPMCFGTGTTPDGKTCTACNGKGTVLNTISNIECSWAGTEEYVAEGQDNSTLSNNESEIFDPWNTQHSALGAKLSTETSANHFSLPTPKTTGLISELSDDARGHFANILRMAVEHNSPVSGASYIVAHNSLSASYISSIYTVNVIVSVNFDTMDAPSVVMALTDLVNPAASEVFRNSLPEIGGDFNILSIAKKLLDLLT